MNDICFVDSPIYRFFGSFWSLVDSSYISWGSEIPLINKGPSIGVGVESNTMVCLCNSFLVFPVYLIVALGLYFIVFKFFVDILGVRSPRKSSKNG